MPGGGKNLRYQHIELPPIEMDAGLNCVSGVVRDGLSYWREKAAGRPMPLRSDIAPEEIIHLLPHICLFEITFHAGGGLSIFPRLAGAKFEEVFGPIHNKPLETVLQPEILQRWLGASRAVVAARAPLRAVGDVLHEDKTFIKFEILMAPLSRNGMDPDMMFLVSHFSMRGEAD
jgi:hypothetical protein